MLLGRCIGSEHPDNTKLQGGDPYQRLASAGWHLLQGRCSVVAQPPETPAYAGVTACARIANRGRVHSNAPWYNAIKYATVIDPPHVPFEVSQIVSAPVEPE